MALYLVTGIAGSGKTQVCHELRERGYEAYDTDDDGLARWQNTKTGFIHPKSSVRPHQRTEEFLAQHRWVVPRERVVQLAQLAVSHSVFLCGWITNEQALDDLFAKTFALHIDKSTLADRLTNRTTNDWGKQPQELKLTLEQYKDMYAAYEAAGDNVHIIDATKPLSGVVTAILDHIDE